MKNIDIIDIISTIIIWIFNILIIFSISLLIFLSYLGSEKLPSYLRYKREDPSSIIYRGKEDIIDLKNKEDLEEKEEIIEQKRYGFSEEEIYLLAQLLTGDENYNGDGEYDFVYTVSINKPLNYYQISLVLIVVMNRVNSTLFDDTVTEVILQGPPKYKKQFSVMPENSNKTPSKISIDLVRKWCEFYDSGNPFVQIVPEDHLYFKAGPNLTNISYSIK